MLKLSILNAVVLLIVVLCSQSSAKPFFNPFNFAITTDFKEDGNVFSITYPKKAQTVSLKFNSKDISENKFDFAGLVSALIRKITSKFRNFNPFQLSSMTTTTTPDPNFDFSEEDNGDIATEEDHFQSSSESSHKSTTDDSSIENTSEDDKDGGYDKNGHSYLPPKPNVTVEPIKLDYLPPKTSTPSSVYLPQN